MALVLASAVHGAWLSPFTHRDVLVALPWRRGSLVALCAAHWSTHVSDDGERYYYNDVSGESRWEPPGEYAWSAHLDEDGETYYYNAVDGTSAWELPPGVQLGEAVPGEVDMPVAEHGVMAAPSDGMAASDTALREEWLLTEDARPERSIGGAIAHGELVLAVPQVASAAECEALLAAGVEACHAQRERTGAAPADGKNRFSVSDATAFDAEVVLSVEELLLRVLDRLDDEVPSIYMHLFEASDGWRDRQAVPAQGRQLISVPPAALADVCPTLRDLYMAGELEWSEGEPAMNVYTTKGGFGKRAAEPKVAEPVAAESCRRPPSRWPSRAGACAMRG